MFLFFDYKQMLSVDHFNLNFADSSLILFFYFACLSSGLIFSIKIVPSHDKTNKLMWAVQRFGKEPQGIYRKVP